jgi:hypothetical protein
MAVENQYKIFDAILVEEERSRKSHSQKYKAVYYLCPVCKERSAGKEENLTRFKNRQACTVHINAKHAKEISEYEQKGVLKPYLNAKRKEDPSTEKTIILAPEAPKIPMSNQPKTKSPEQKPTPKKSGWFDWLEDEDEVEE